MKTEEAQLLQALCAIDDPGEMRRVLADILRRGYVLDPSV